MYRFVVVCCSVLLCVAGCCRVLQVVAVHCNALQCVAVFVSRCAVRSMFAYKEDMIKSLVNFLFLLKIIHQN